MNCGLEGKPRDKGDKTRVRTKHLSLMPLIIRSE